MKFKNNALLFLFLLFVWSRLGAQEIRNSNLIWALSAENILVIDSLHTSNKLAGTNLFNSVVNAVQKGKLKAYRNYPAVEELSTEEFNNILVYWDSSYTSDNNDGGELLPAPIKVEVYPEELVEIRFDERMEFDTLSYRLIKKIRSADFIINRRNEKGEVIGKTFLFKIKFNEQNKSSQKNMMIIAEKSESFIPMKRDSIYYEEEWYQKYIMDKEVIYNSITQAGLKGKIKIFSEDPTHALSQKEFYNTVNQFDSTAIICDPNNPSMTTRVIQTAYTSSDIVQLKFQEKILFDTVSFTLSKEVLHVTYIINNVTETGEVAGLKELYSAELNN